VVVVVVVMNDEMGISLPRETSPSLALASVGDGKTLDGDGTECDLDKESLSLRG
jgi:hypothetical protein